MTTVKEIADEIVALQSRKNADYGNAFGISMQEFGLVAPAIRLTDKLNRFKSLIKKEAEVKSESIEDTLIDLAAYAMMTVVEMRNGEVVSEKICKEIIENAGLKVDSDNHLNCGDKVILKENIVGRDGLDIKKGEKGEVVGSFETSGYLYVSFESGWTCMVKPDVLERI